jgi:hypothetical protein
MPNKSEEILKKIKTFEDKLLSEFYSDEEYGELLKISGISDRDLIILRESLDEYVTRAEGFMQHRLFQEALSELNSARLISPKDLKVNLYLSKVSLELYNQNRDELKKIDAKKFAHICLKLDADNKDALSILAELQKESSTKIALKNKTYKNIKILVAILLFTMLILVFFFYSGNGLGNSKIKRQYSKVEKNTTSKNEFKDKLNNIPVEFSSENAQEKFKLDVRNSSLSVFNNKSQSYSYKLNAFISSGNVYKNLILIYTAVDADGKEIFFGKMYPKISPKGSRPNDKIAITSIIYENKSVPDIKKIILKTSELKTLNRLANYPSVKEIKVVKKFPQTIPATDLSVLERESEIKYNSLSKAIFHNLTLEIENTGKTIIDDIEANITWYDSAKQPISSYRWHLHSGIGLRPGDKTPVYTVLTIEKEKAEVAYYEIEILKTAE